MPLEHDTTQSTQGFTCVLCGKHTHTPPVDYRCTCSSAGAYVGVIGLELISAIRQAQVGEA